MSFHWYVSILLTLSLTACSVEKLQFSFGDTQTLSGKLVGFPQSSALRNLSSDVSVMSCSSPQVSIYKIDSNGVRADSVLGSTSISSDGSYSFKLSQLGFSNGKMVTDPLIAIVSGCTSGVYLRPITGAKDQDISAGSTLVGYLLGTSNKSDLSSSLLSNVTEVEALIKSLANEQTFDAAYSLMNSDSAISNQFQGLFGAMPTILSEASPEIVSLTIPQTAQEGSAVNLIASGTQWSSAYSTAYEWKLENTVLSHSSNLSYTPKANSQGEHTLTLTIGKSDGSGSVDGTKPVKVITRRIAISNNLLPVSPSLSVTSPVVVGMQPINSRNITVTIATGANKINCDSFSSLALVEGTEAQPSSSDFSITCSQAGTQDVSFAVTSSGDGTKTLYLWAMDAAGVISTSASTYSFNLDTGAPVASISTTPLAMSNTSSQSFVFTGTDNGGSIDYFECKMDSGSWSQCSSPQSYSSLAEGDHTFSLRAVDTAGNTSSVETKTWHIDLTAPMLSLTGSPDSVTNSLSATFNFSATDSGGSGFANYYCQLDSASSFTQCAAIQNYALTSGAHTLKYKGVDVAGNYSSAQIYSWTIDTTPPTVSITSKPSSLTNSQTASFSFSGSDTGGGAVASFECQVDGASYAACTSPKSYSSLAESSHTFAVRAIDTAGNVGTSVSYSWTIDLTTPIASINSGPDSITNSTSATFTFSANAPPSGSITGYECKLDAAAWSSCASPKTYSGLTEGSYTFQVRSIDNNSNYSTATSETWTIDTTAPVVTVSSAPSSLNSSSSASFSFSAIDSGGGSVVGYQCRLDSGSYADCSSPKNLTGLAEGSHTYSITATDSAGNTSAAVNTTWTVDLTAPALTLSSTPNLVTNSTTGSFSFSATDSGGGTVSSYSCSIDGAAYASCTSPKSYSSLAAGAHTFAVIVIDSVGNTSSAMAYSWTVDLTAPTLSITSKPNLITNAVNASFSFSGTDTGGGAIASYACKMDSGSYATCTSPQAYSSLTAGAHTFYVTATDTAGNTSSAQSYAWTIDTTPPTVTITTPSTDGTVVLSSTLGSYSVGGACSENGVSVVLSGASSLTVPCSSGAWSTNIDISSLSDGTLSLTATQTDTAGNSASSAARTFIKDSVAPAISITTPTAFQGNTSSGSVTWSLTELNVPSSTSFTVEIYNGSSWSSVGTKAATAGANSNQSYTLSGFAVPSVDTNAAKIRVTLTDAAGNTTSQVSGTFIIDKTPPTLSSVNINDGAQYAGTAVVNVKVNLTDNYFTGTNLKVRLALANTGTSDCQSEYADSNWQTWTSSSTNIPFTFVPTDGTKKICVWAKDLVGNISTISPTTGTANVDYDTIEYSTGNPPVIASFSVTNTSTGGYTASSGNALTIQWSATDVEGLDNNPVSISYTTDNSTWKDIYTNLDISTLSNKTWVGGLSGNPTSASGTITTFTAPSSSYFRLKIQAKDMAGNTSSVIMSQTFNTGNWSIYAGNTDRGDGGTGRGATLTSYILRSVFAINPLNGDIYAVDNLLGVRKLDAKTGIVSTFIKQGTLNLPDDGQWPANPLMNVNAYLNPMFDSKGRLYLGVQQSGSYWASVIYQIDLEQGTVRKYAGGGLGDDGGVNSTSLQVVSGGYSFDDQDSLYVWTYCNGGVLVGTSATAIAIGKRIVKIEQNSDGTPGSTTRIIGDCTKANPASGNVAYSQPAGNSSYTAVATSIAAWNGGKVILVNPYGATAYKIIDGTVYSTNLSGYSWVTYNRADGFSYRSNGGTTIEKIAVNTAGAGGDVATTVFNYNSANSGCASDQTTLSNFCGYLSQMVFSSGIMYFVDGTWSDTSLGTYSIRYFDTSGQLRTVFGSKPFYGDGLDRSLARGTFNGIAYKKSTELNQTAFPEGLYFMEQKGLVLGRIEPSTNKITQLWGNQSLVSWTPVTGTQISAGISMGRPAIGDGSPLAFDKDGLPWLRINNDAVSIDTNNKVVRRTTQSVSTTAQNAPDNADPSLYGLMRYIGSQNFTLKNQGLFAMPNWYDLNSSANPILTIRYMDFGNSIMRILLGGSYKVADNSSASPDITTAGQVSVAPLWVSCRDSGNCFMQYTADDDRLYFSENTNIRYITTPDVPSTSTLGTLFSSTHGRIYNFIFTPDKKQLWYFNSGGNLYCKDISSGKSWCDNTTDYFSIRTAAGFTYSSGANQMTFKDNQTMFLSTYNGLILQFNLPTTP